MDRLLDVETRDAHAGGDGGAPACNCPEAPRSEYSFRGGAVTRGGSDTQEPHADFSSVQIRAAEPVRHEDGTLIVSISVQVAYYLRDGSFAGVICALHARPDGTVLSRVAFAGTPAQQTYDVRCGSVYYRSADGRVSAVPAMATADQQVYLTGARVTDFATNRFTVALPPIALRFRRSEDGGTIETEGTLGALTVHASVPDAQWFTPPRMYRP